VSGPFRHRLRVRYNECDPQGVVFNANYLTFDITITELWRMSATELAETIQSNRFRRMRT